MSWDTYTIRYRSLFNAFVSLPLNIFAFLTLPIYLLPFASPIQRDTRNDIGPPATATSINIFASRCLQRRRVTVRRAHSTRSTEISLFVEFSVAVKYNLFVPKDHFIWLRQLLLGVLKWNIFFSRCECRYGRVFVFSVQCSLVCVVVHGLSWI